MHGKVWELSLQACPNSILTGISLIISTFPSFDQDIAKKASIQDFYMEQFVPQSQEGSSLVVMSHVEGKVHKSETSWGCVDPYVEISQTEQQL